MNEGVWTALITPFTPDDCLDEEGLHLLIARQREANVAGIVALGTTGEAPTLTADEKRQVISICREEGIPFMVGTGTNSTRTTIQQTIEAANYGAIAALVISPYYNRPPDRGLYQHFATVADMSPIPIILYDHPGRTGVTLTQTLRAQLSVHPNIAAIKDATGSIECMASSLPFMDVYSGDDSLTWELREKGGKGVISVIANLFPKEMVALWKGDTTACSFLQPYIKASALESNPIPIKAMMRLTGLPAGGCRLPLCEPSSATTQHLEQLLCRATQTSPS